MIKLDDALAGVTALGIDTAPLIYFMEANPHYDSVVNQVFQRIDIHAFDGVTSSVSLLEVLVMPIRKEDLHLQEEYRNLLLASNHFQTLAITTEIAEHAASLRARYRLKTPDALQIATALSAGCEAFLTNDAELRRVAELQVLILDELEL